MILLSVRDLLRQFDVAPVFKNVTFDVRPGERIGLVGPNGSGKTTLLKILAGLDEADAGEVERHPSAEVALLEQEADFAPDRTLLEEAKAGLAHLYGLQTEATDLAHKIAAQAAVGRTILSAEERIEMKSVEGGQDCPPHEVDAATLERLHRRYDQLQQELHRLDAYNIDHRVDEVLAGLGFRREEYDRPLRQFSGGQQNRAILARMLLRAPDVMLLDEPTNHLDIAATEWLEDYLLHSNQAIILVSHDRFFLDRVTNRILEIFSGAVTDYRGNFSAYWEQREERYKVLERTYEKQQEFIAKTEDFIRRNKYGQTHAQATDREKKLSRLERVELPKQIAELPMGFGKPSRSGDWVIDAVDVSKGFETPLFTEFTLRIERGDRVGMFGPNGSGKTTLLRTLIGDLKPDVGTVRLGTGVKIGYYDQQLSGVDPEVNAIEAVRPPGDLSFTPAKARELLARFGIRGEMAFQEIGSMSGGEKSKVALARLAALNVNLLVLDEPTNHLDLWARASLENALKEFDGTLLFVSHDRYFLDRVATRVIVLEPDRWRFYKGNYSDYVLFLKNLVLETQAEKSAQTTAADTQATSSGKRTDGDGQQTRRRRRFPYRKVEDLETEIHETEALVEQLEADMANPDLHRNGQRVKETVQQYEDAKGRLERLYEHWEEAVELN